MASMAVQWPVDKDQSQIPYWLNNDEMAVAGDNFFDQYVTFDTGDGTASRSELFEDPPSPSVLLESLEGSLTQSSSADRDSQSIQSQAEATAATAAATSFPEPQLTFPAPVTAAESDASARAGLLAPAEDPVLGGSISDAELLRLEGISLKSPGTGLSRAPASPPYEDTAAAAAAFSASPRKHGRFIDSVYATFRRATHRGPRPNKQQPQQQEPGDFASMGMFLAPEPQPAVVDVDIKPEPVDHNGLPLSPPLTGRIPYDTRATHNPMRFVSGALDDPFVVTAADDGQLRGPAAVHNTAGGIQTTPLSTPLLGPDGLYAPPQHHHPHAMGAPLAFRHPPHPHHLHQHQQPQYQRSTNSAEWPMEGLLADGGGGNGGSGGPGVNRSCSLSGDDVRLWSSSYVPDSNGGGGGGSDGLPSREWWDPATRSRAPSSSAHFHGNPPPPSADLPSYVYGGGGGAELSGLMIHMPQPRAPQAAVLSASLDGANNSNHNHNNPCPSPGASGTAGLTTSSYPPPPASYHGGHYAEPPPLLLPPHSHHGGSSSRRPRPRAPSSGARHHGHGSLTSPRKLHHSGSRGYLRQQQQQQSGQQGGQSSEPQQPPSPSPRSSSLSVRKRRSWCRQQQQQQAQQQQQMLPRTPSLDLGDASIAGLDVTISRSSSSGAGGSTIGFVNYTPSDKNVLMGGVAPSGSSKTKARREKEALEKRRRLSAAALRAVRDAGGDIDRLREEGFVV
ncbi:hypothetical protein GGR56DRAFT_652656 [Xylariaceae sp. FL0804]|nr:hypothetical protein GGR56DRAFT_652656 [Xylariaceae sp. FL0804]